jgi:hypothetical protein
LFAVVFLVLQLALLGLILGVSSMPEPFLCPIASSFAPSLNEIIHDVV